MALSEEERAAWGWAKQCARQDSEDGIGWTKVGSALLLAVAAHLAEVEVALREAIRHCPECAGDGRLMFDPRTHQSIMEPWENLPTCPRCKGWRAVIEESK